MENKKATLYIEFRHNQARLDLIGNTHVALKECVKPYGIRNHTYQRDKIIHFCILQKYRNPCKSYGLQGFSFWRVFSHKKKYKNCNNAIKTIDIGIICDIIRLYYLI